MDWLKRLFIGGIRDAAKKEMANFRWSDRERQALQAAGYTEQEIALSEKVNRVAGGGWIDRQVK